MDNRIKFYFSKLLQYKNKLIQILFYEIFYTLKLGDRYYKIHNNDLYTDALPCPYYFLYEISKFVKNHNITNIVDLGSGTGRVVNFLANSTEKKVTGYEIDKELVHYSISKKKNKNANFFNGDFNLLNFDKLNADCYVFNSPLKKKADIKKVIEKIKLLKNNYFLIVINIDSHLDSFTLSEFFKNFKLIKFIKAGEIKTLRIYENKL